MPKADFIADGVLTPDLKYQLDSSYYPDLPIVSQNHSAEDVIDYNANPYVILIQYNSGRTGVFSIGSIRKYNQQEVDDLKA